MLHKMPRRVATACLLLLIPGLLIACGDRDTDEGLSRAEVEEIVRAGIPDTPAPAGPGLSRDEVERIVQSAVAGIPTPEPGLTLADVRQVVQAAIAGIPEPEPGVTRDDVVEILEKSVQQTPLTDLTAPDVDRIVQARLAELPQPESSLTRADIEEVVRAAIAGIPQPDTGLTYEEVIVVVNETVIEILDQVLPSEPGLTREEVFRIARNAVASIPPKTSPAEYTKFFVDNAIAKYDSEGLAATLAHYNRVDSVDGQWYVFIVDQGDEIIGHYDAHLLGEDLKGPVGIDANGYNFGAEMVSATDRGKWVSYVYRNPETGVVSSNFEQFELKNAWVVRHAGLLFGSGWYIPADEFTRQLVSVAVDRFRSGGLQATVEYFASPGSALAGLETAIAYYNEAETVEGQWFAFIGDKEGRIVAHSDPAMVGKETQELFGMVTFDASMDGSWVTTEFLRVWVVGHEGFVFGSGWNRAT